MSKVVLDDIQGGYSLSKINQNFERIENELNSKVLYRDSPEGEPNEMHESLDMNGFDIYNVNEVRTTDLLLSGISILEYIQSIETPVVDPIQVAMRRATFNVPVGGATQFSLPYPYPGNKTGILVIRNGVLQDPSSFELPSQFLVAFNEPLLEGEIVEIIYFNVEVGLQGDPGANGLSAYDIAINNGFIGSEQDWLDSLEGPQGIQGEQGIQGIQGIQGEAGPAGVGIDNIVRTNGDGSPGTTDTYTITYSDLTTSTFDVYNGADGQLNSVVAGDGIDVDDTDPANPIVSTTLSTQLADIGSLFMSGDAVGLATEGVGGWLADLPRYNGTDLDDVTWPALMSVSQVIDIDLDPDPPTFIDNYPAFVGGSCALLCMPLHAGTLGQVVQWAFGNDASTEAVWAARTYSSGVWSPWRVSVDYESLVGPLGNTWEGTQTFDGDVAFTDASQARGALGLGTAATRNTGTSGTTVPLLDGSNTWSARQKFGDIGETTTTLTGTTPSISTAGGTIKTWALSGASTPTSGLADGDSVTIQITPTTHSINWTNFNVGDAGAPPLTNGKITTVVIYRIGATSFVDFVRQH